MLVALSKPIRDFLEKVLQELNEHDQTTHCCIINTETSISDVFDMIVATWQEPNPMRISTTAQYIAWYLGRR